jgi:hypothetical protein
MTATATLTATWAKAPNGAWAAKLPTTTDLPAEGTPITVVKRDGTEKVVYATSESYATRYGLLVAITSVNPAKPAPAPLDEGVYVTADGDYVQAVRGSRGYLFGKVWTGARFTYRAGALAGLTAANKITAEQAAEFGYTNSRCVFCARDLSTAESTAVGYGPVCAARYDLPWGATPEAAADAAYGSPESWESLAELQSAEESAAQFDAAAEAAAEAEWRRANGGFTFEFDQREETGWNRAL